MSIKNQFQRAEKKPRPAARLMAAAKEMHAIAKGEVKPAAVHIPRAQKKQVISIRLDPDVIEKFKKKGPGWQTKMNDVLKAAKL